MQYTYVIKLKTDAEPSNGEGNENLNSQLPRNEQNRVCIPASHMKGLMRENLETILSGFRKDSDQIVKTLFGAEGESGSGGKRALVRLVSAVAPADAKIITITRTALESGHIKYGSLRTTEALAAGTELTGEIVCDFENETLLKAVRLALLSVTSIGGSRTRGAGECRITIEGFEKETPGQLFRDIVKASDIANVESPAEYRPDSPALPEEADVMLKVIFEVKQPVCIPKAPIGKNNVITSGFAIPGTAVAGTLLTLMSAKDPDTASACYRSPIFRCYPLLPVSAGEKECAYPVRVSNSHKISKLPEGDEKRFLFGDLMIPDKYLEESDYHWQEKTGNLAMKGTDGVLLVGKDKSVSLLKEKSIPRVYTAHGVVNGTGEKKDNLFTQEAVSVSKFEGLVFIPRKAADVLLERIGTGVSVAFGKSKSTMGGGTLKLERCDGLEFQQIKKLRNRLFIVQTPVVFEMENTEPVSSSQVMVQVLKDSGWGELEDESVMTSVIFGWNEQPGLETKINGTNRVRARRVITPGSVFLLKDPIPENELAGKLAKGLGKDVTPGFGAVIPHPMFASKLVEAEKPVSSKVFPKAMEDDPVYVGYRLDSIAGTKLSGSQIAHLLRATQTSKKEALEFLRIQKEDRPKQIWECWESVHSTLEQYLKNEKYDAVAMLKVWHDLRKGRKG